jgi:acyl-CoA synthetase (AMP-forming)/AMP-acid ligase II
VGPESKTLDRLLRRAANHPEAGLRILDRTERVRWMSWSDVYRRAREVGGALQAVGVGRTDRVGVVFPTGGEFFEAFFGVLLAGAVPVPLYPPVRLGRLGEYHRRTARMLELVDARLVLADKRVKRILGPAIRLAPPALGCRTLDELPATGGARPVRSNPHDLALVQFSSGTTVDPKPVALSQAAILAQVELLNGLWPDRADRKHSGVSWLPLYHDMGLVGTVFTALERPAALTLIPPELFIARPAVWLRAISKYRATISPAPNFAYSLCVSRITDEELQGVDLSCWRFALNGAECVVPTVARSFQERFARWGFRPEAMTPVYGLSEATLAVTFSDGGQPFRSGRFSREALAERNEAHEAPGGREIVSVGRPLTGFMLRIVDERGFELPERKVGRVLVRGPSLMHGYLDQPDATARIMKDGWLDTGDLGFLIDGELYLTSRAKDTLILHGRNHAPQEFEEAVDAVPGVRTGCAVAVSHPPEGETGEWLLLFVEAGRKVSRSEYAAIGVACARTVLAATGLAAQRVRVLEPGTLPRTSSGKLRRQETLRRHLNATLLPPAAVTPLRLAGAVTRSTLAYARLRWDNLGSNTES